MSTEDRRVSRVRGVRLLLLCHGEVASHRGDVPITPHGFERARETGRRLGSELSGPEPMRLLSADTLRARQTIDAIYQGAVESAGEDRVLAPRVASRCATPTCTWPGSGLTW